MIDQNEVKRLFDYIDGILYWKTKTTARTNNIVIGTSAGRINSQGYLQTMIYGNRYLNHRLIFLYHHGYMPENMVDHIDRNTLNNRIENLREVTQQCNVRNSKLNKINESGVNGVSWNKKLNKWKSIVGINYNTKYLGIHIDFTEAVAHRLAVEQCLDWNGCDSCSTAFLHMKKYLIKNNSK